MNKIIKSLSVIAFVGAIALTMTGAYFSDTETSTGNKFTAGTIDISINDMNPWEESFVLEDMKPCYTDYINFRINNDRSDPNPVNIFKDIDVTCEETGTVSEPECTEQYGIWNSTTQTCDWNGSFPDSNDLSSAIWYDLFVEVYNASGDKIWYQTIYVDGDKQSIDDVYANGQVFLGMIPMGGYMLVEQSYHLSPRTTNWAQGDSMEFGIEVYGEQLHGEAWLENKDESQNWKIVHTDDFKGTLTYEVKHPTFDFEFTGKAPKANHSYDLMVITDIPNDKGVLLGTAISNGTGDITITGDFNTGDVKDAKVWLITSGHVDPATGNWSGYSPNDYLWETGLIWYEDTDL